MLLAHPSIWKNSPIGNKTHEVLMHCSTCPANWPLFETIAAAIVELAEHRVSMGKVADSRFDSQSCNTSSFWKRHAYFCSGPSSLPLVVAQPDKRLANRPQKCGWTDAEHWVRMHGVNEVVYRTFHLQIIQV